MLERPGAPVDQPPLLLAVIQQAYLFVLTHLEAL